MCKNDFLEAETKYNIEKLAFATIMIRPRDLPDSIVAQLVSVSTFLHSLDPLRTLGLDGHAHPSTIIFEVTCDQLGRSRWRTM